MARAAKPGRLDGIDAARGVAISLMILSHTVKSLLSFKQMPDWGVVPVHLVTKFSSSLFILVFGVSVAVIYVPKVGTDAWPKARWKILRRAVLVMFWYKVLSVVQMFERSTPDIIIETLLFKRFPDFVEVLQFYGWFLLVLPLILPLWGRLWVPGRFMMVFAFGLAAHLLQQFDFWGIWQLKAVFVEQPDVFCFGIFTRGTMALAGMLLGDLLTAGKDKERGKLLLSGVCLFLGMTFAAWFIVSEGEGLQVTMRELAENWGKHPPNLPFIAFTFAGAFTILGLCLAAGRHVLALLHPFVMLGRESLFCFNLHILVIFLVYRFTFGFRREVTYEEALLLTGLLIVVAAIAAALYNSLKRWLRREGKDSERAHPDPSHDHVTDAWVWGDASSSELAKLAGRPTVVGDDDGPGV